jgi:hypothetical protein
MWASQMQSSYSDAPSTIEIARQEIFQNLRPFENSEGAAARTFEIV